MTGFGESAPAEQLYEEFGFTVHGTVAKAAALVLIWPLIYFTYM